MQLNVDKSDTVEKKGLRCAIIYIKLKAWMQSRRWKREMRSESRRRLINPPPTEKSYMSKWVEGVGEVVGDGGETPEVS